MDDVFLWEKFIKIKDLKIKEQFIIKYMLFVKFVVGRMVIYFGGNVEYDDLVSYGLIGFFDVIEKFDS